ncbi:MAG: aldo/keto reductase [Spongiibacteraceae bacterium]|jgi:aryl-alcohol dehydrogenase-like predicted oxidoreductase|nr:aldo/keto reductase [Spongiibacteraceae bacterium]
MRYKLFGHTGLRVSELCLGTMTFGEGWGWGSSREESCAVFDAFVAAGGNFFDTADVYTGGDSERLLGDFVRGQRERCVVATKYSASIPTEGAQAHPLTSGNSRKHLMDAVHASLQRLNMDYIDILWVHCWDFLTPVEEVMRGLDDLVRTGKVCYVGVSNAPAWVVAKANTLAGQRGWTPFSGLQLKYNVLDRDIEPEFLPLARDLDLAITAWSPLAGGVLSGKYQRDDVAATADSKRAALYADSLPARAWAVAEALSAVAAECDATASQVALAWLRQRDPRVIPVIGARTVAQLEDNLGSVELSLSADQLARLSALAPPALPFPHDLLHSPEQIQRSYGGYLEHIDQHRPRLFPLD